MAISFLVIVIASGTRWMTMIKLLSSPFSSSIVAATKITDRQEQKNNSGGGGRSRGNASHRTREQTTKSLMEGGGGRVGEMTEENQKNAERGEERGKKVKQNKQDILSKCSNHQSVAFLSLPFQTYLPSLRDVTTIWGIGRDFSFFRLTDYRTRERRAAAAFHRWLYLLSIIGVLWPSNMNSLYQGFYSEREREKD